MKILLSILFITKSFFSFGQKVDSIPKLQDGYGYENVVKLDTAFTKEKLYRNAKVFFVDVFKSAKDVIQYDDRSEGKIIGKGLFKIERVEKENLLYSANIYWKVYFSVEIICKEGKYKYRVYDIKIDEDAVLSDNSVDNKEMFIDDILQTKNKKQKKCYESMYNNAVVQFENTISNLKNYMDKKDIAKDDF